MRTKIVNYINNIWTGIDENEAFNKNVQLIIVFAERSLLEKGIVVKKLKTVYPKAKIISCSTAGEINDNNSQENSAVCTIISFDHTPFNIVADNIKNHKNSFELGAELSKKLPTKDLKYVWIVSDGGLINGDDLIKGIQSVTGKSVMVSGGLAGDGANFEKTLVGLDENIASGNLVLLGLYGNKIKVGSGYQGGWDVFGPERTITKSKDNVLFEIDNENALDLYKKYLGKYSEELPSSALLFPLSVKSANDDFFLVRTILSIDEKNKSMTFAGNLPEGSTVRFMKSNFDRLVNAAADAATEAVVNMGKNIPVNLALFVSCVGRKLVLNQRIDEELEAAMDNITKGATVAGFFSYGEIAPQQNNKTSHLHNQTMTITTFAELP
jgi:hypothetical protein